MKENEISYILRNNIKNLRKRLGWSQEYLAERTGVSAPYITQIENGLRTPSLDIVQKVSKALGVEYKELFENQNPLIISNTTSNYSNHILEARIINAIIEIIHKEFNQSDI